MGKPEMMPIKIPIPAATYKANRLVFEYLVHRTPTITGTIIANPSDLVLGTISAEIPFHV